MAINIGQVAAVISGVEQQRSRIEQEALAKEQAELNLKLGSEQLKTATMQNEALRKTLPIRIEEEFLRLKQTQADTFMKSVDAEFYRETAENDLEFNRMRLRAMDMEFKIKARDSILDPWAEEMFKEQNYTEKDINSRMERMTYSVNKKLNTLLEDPEKLDEHINGLTEELTGLQNRINENKQNYARTKDPKYMEENETLTNIAADVFAEVKIINSSVDEYKQTVLEVSKNKDRMARDESTNLAQQKTDLRKLFDSKKSEFYSRQPNNALGGLKQDFQQQEREATAYAMDYFINSDILRQNFPEAYASLSRQYGTLDVGDILSNVFTGGKYGTKEFSFETFETLSSDFSSMGGQIYADEARKVYTTEFKNYLIDNINQGKFDIKAFNKKVSDQRNILTGNMSQNTQQSRQMTPSERESIFVEARSRLHNDSRINLENMTTFDVQELFANIYADVAREKGIKPDMTLFMDYEPELNDALLMTDTNTESEDNNNE